MQEIHHSTVFSCLPVTGCVVLTHTPTVSGAQLSVAGSQSHRSACSQSARLSARSPAETGQRFHCLPLNDRKRLTLRIQIGGRWANSHPCASSYVVPVANIGLPNDGV